MDKKLTEGTTPIDYEGTLKSLTESYYNALDSINRLQSENEELVENIDKLKESNSNLTVELQAMRGAANSYKAEIERLKDFQNSVYETVDEISNKIKAEAVKECIEKVKKEINEALINNYKVRSERAQSIPIYTEDEFWNYCAGKIDCLRGLDDFLDNLLKELVENENEKI